jgi:hypothetical protein
LFGALAFGVGQTEKGFQPISAIKQYETNSRLSFDVTKL